jgi:translocator protein
VETEIERIVTLFPFAVVCFAAGYIGSRLTRPSLPVWYARLRKPSWAPPNEVFGPLWTLLYLAMAIAAWWVWEDRGFDGAPGALILFAIQLILNVFWSYLFFARRRPDLAFYEVVALWLAILGTVVAFWDVSTASGALMLPYLLWTAFAGALNFRVWRMNEP